MTSKPEPLLWLSDARGVYIPRDFARSFRNYHINVEGVSSEQWAVLGAGPDHEHYWDVWNNVEQSATVTGVDDKDTKFTLYQDGDLWLIPVGMEFDEAEGFFKWLDEYPVQHDEDEVIEPEDQDPGDVLGEHDEKPEF